MSFIPHRDVYSVDEDDLDHLSRLYDEMEDRYIRDWVKDEYGDDWTPEMVLQEKGPGSLPMSIGGWDMLVYLYGEQKLRGY